MQDIDKTKEQLIQEINELRQQLAKSHNLEAEYGQAMAELRYTEAQNQAILRALPDLMFRLSKEGIHIDFHSSNLEQLFVQPEDFLGKSVEEVLPAETAQKYQYFIGKTLETNHEQFFEYHLDFEKIGRVYYEARMVVIDADEVLVMVRDITVHKQLQEEHQKAELLRIKLEQQKEIVALKERFVSVVSHEFRTPLAVISTNIHLLANYSDRLDEDRCAQKFAQIERQIIHLSDLIDQVLIVGRRQSGNIIFKPTSLNVGAFCRDIFEQVQASTESERQFEFKNLIPDFHAMLDSDMVQHILTNLLSNAIKYSSEGGLVRLTVDRTEDNIFLIVTDNGVGISETEQDYIFEAFFRSASVGPVQGTGLGLFITHENVKLHGGKIEVNSQLGQGSSFTVSLPLC